MKMQGKKEIKMKKKDIRIRLLVLGGAYLQEDESIQAVWLLENMGFKQAKDGGFNYHNEQFEKRFGHKVTVTVCPLMSWFFSPASIEGAKEGLKRGDYLITQGAHTRLVETNNGMWRSLYSNIGTRMVLYCDPLLLPQHSGAQSERGGPVHYQWFSKTKKELDVKASLEALQKFPAELVLAQAKISSFETIFLGMVNALAIKLKPLNAHEILNAYLEKSDVLNLRLGAKNLSLFDQDPELTIRTLKGDGGENTPSSS